MPPLFPDAFISTLIMLHVAFCVEGRYGEQNTLHNSIDRGEKRRFDLCHTTV